MHANHVHERGRVDLGSGAECRVPVVPAPAAVSRSQDREISRRILSRIPGSAPEIVVPQFYFRGMAGGFAAAVEALHAAVDGLLSSDLALVPAADLAGLFAALETERRRLAAVDHDL